MGLKDAIDDESNPGLKYFLWGLGVMLSVHIVNWINVSYFDQFRVIWFLQLAIISSLSGDTNIALIPAAQNNEGSI